MRMDISSPIRMSVVIAPSSRHSMKPTTPFLGVPPVLARIVNAVTDGGLCVAARSPIACCFLGDPTRGEARTSLPRGNEKED